MVQNLLERGCPLDVRDRAGNLPWHFAVHGKAVDLVTYLLDRGCPLDAVNDSGQNALHFAAETGATPGMPRLSTVYAVLVARPMFYPAPCSSVRTQQLVAHQSQTNTALRHRFGR